MTQTSPADVLGIINGAAMRDLITEVVRAELAPVLAAIEHRDPGDELLGAGEFAALLKVDRRTLRRFISEHAVPPPIMIAARLPRWRRIDIDRWLESGAQQDPALRCARPRGSMSRVETRT